MFSPVIFELKPCLKFQITQTSQQLSVILELRDTLGRFACHPRLTPRPRRSMGNFNPVTNLPSLAFCSD